MKSRFRVLLLVTYQFPFGKGETFVADELKFLSLSFDEILILPARSLFNRRWLNGIQHEPMNSEMPRNCQVLLPTQGRFTSFFGSIRWFVKLIRKSAAEVVPRLTSFKALQDFGLESIKCSLFSTKLNHLWRTQIESKYNVALVYCYWKTEPATAFSLLAKTSPDEFRFVTRCHGGDLYYDLPTRLTRPYDPFVARFCSKVLPISETGASHLIQHGFPPQKILTQRLGIDLPLEVSRPSSDGVWRIMSCSNVIPIKRVDLIAESLGRLKQPFEWTHFGDGSEMQKVKKIVDGFPPFGSAILKGAQPRSEVFDFFRTQPIDLFVNLSVTEGVPVSAMEALAYGVPVLATDAGGTRELIDSKVGRLVPIQINAEYLAELIAEELSTLRPEKRLAARSRAETLCDAAVNYSTFANTLLTLADLR